MSDLLNPPENSDSPERSEAEAEPETARKESPESGTDRGSYYYDDAYGYEEYEPENDEKSD